jgi:hypothetical protein
MLNTLEKRILVHQWIEEASEEEVEVFYDSLMEDRDEHYSKVLLEELDRRRDLHLRGISPSFSLEELKEKIDTRRKEKYGL